ncbi:hypothetical protein ACFE04_002367 [Oxalis oulophora]
MTKQATTTTIAMDWFSWLSKTTLEPSLTYEYGLLFTRNELQEGDLAYFNHEFLQSMGISVAKHRLEILKLSRKEVGSTSIGFAKLVSVLSKTRRLKRAVTKIFGKKCIHEDALVIRSPPEETTRWKGSGALTRYKSDKDLNMSLPTIKTRTIAKSGPLDGRHMQDKLMITNRSLKLSGPLDKKVQDRLVFAYKSPKLSVPLDGKVHVDMYPNRSPKSEKPFASPNVYNDYRKENAGEYYDDHSLWSTLFHDMKPT